MKKTQNTGQKQGTSFSAEFQSALKNDKDTLTISKHAQERLEQRGITINAERWEQIDEKVKQAKTMGVKELLVLLEDAALIVSAKNNTVITAMNREEASTQIFTNINGTILMD
ncbi:TIGR02530 family flagellar biosynthesis protein [Niallia oryzisoli]|uniref:TIGR02530 family flagellar biosynthesis protein n=2 Tax=Niallia oryzisoli TaxID=1737571 RepID=A0ABZ2CTD6_9BACI